jgi:IS30 family transposase
MIDFGVHVYSAAVAHQRANEQAQISHRKPLILEQNGILKIVIHKLKKRWSPQMISTWLKKNKNMSVSHETIYKYISVQAKG